MERDTARRAAIGGLIFVMAFALVLGVIALVLDLPGAR
jgi:hypothetical protein